MTEAIGQPEVLREMLKRLAAREWAGRTVKMRARDKEGNPAVAVMATETAG